MAKKRAEAAKTVPRMRRYRRKHADAPLAAKVTSPGTPQKIFHTAQPLGKSSYSSSEPVAP